MKSFVEYLKAVKLPFVEITEEHVTQATFAFLNSDLYDDMIHKFGSIYNLPTLKLSNYIKKVGVVNVVQGKREYLL